MIFVHVLMKEKRGFCNPQIMNNYFFFEVFLVVVFAGAFFLAAIGRH